jgi:putative serine protease PepD
MSDNKSHYNNQFLGEPVKLNPTQTSSKPELTASKPTRFLVLLVSMILGPLLGVFIGAYAVNGSLPFVSNSSQIVVNNNADVNWVTAAASKALPSVVTLSVSSASGAGTGSGVVLTADGYILTNAHVVTLDGATSKVVIEVKSSTDKIYKATVVGTDPTNDLAVVKADGAGFIPAEFTDSGSVNVGAYAVAIGAPLGFDATVTAGVISALHRTIQVASSAVPDSGSSLQLWNDGNSQPPVNLDVIQTDAAINPGNSGGALVDDKGQVIGINVAIATATATSTTQSGSIGVGFAIPSNTAKRVADQIIKTGKVSHGLLGAFVTDATNSTAAASFTIGAKIVKLTPGGPAEKAGLKIDDVIISCDGESIDGASKLTAAIRSKAAYSKTTLSITRNGKTITLTATLGDADATN